MNEIFVQNFKRRVEERKSAQKNGRKILDRKHCGAEEKSKNRKMLPHPFRKHQERKMKTQHQTASKKQERKWSILRPHVSTKRVA